MAEIEVARAPAEQAGVERNDEGGETGGFGAAEEAAGEVAVAAPVELKKTRGVAHGGGDFLDGAGRLATEGEGNFPRSGGAGGGEFALGVVELVEADGGDDERGGRGLAVDRRGEGARGDVGEHARHDAPRGEVGAVGGDGFLLAGAADVGVGLGRERGLRASAEAFEGNGQAGCAVVAAVPVDFHLMADAETADGGGGHGGGGRSWR